jgi:hypothetical protein
VPLPNTKQTREGRTPLNVRVLLAGLPKVGKSALAASWAPDTTLIVDTQRGTTLLPGEHYVQHVNGWLQFETVVSELVAGRHQFKTVVLDLIDDLWTFADEHYAGKNAVLASATDDWQRSIKTAEGMFRRDIGRLLATGMGVWFIGHARDKQDGQLTRYVPKLDSRVLTYVQGACDVILLAENLGSRRVLHTAASAKFEAGSRVPLPDPMTLPEDPTGRKGALALYQAIERGLAPTTARASNDTNGNETTANRPVEVAA